ARQLRVTFAGHDVMRNQSRGVEAPYDSMPTVMDLRLDLGRGRIVREGSNSFPGGAHRRFRSVTDSARHYRMDLRTGTYEVPEWPAVERQYGNLFLLPQHILLAARENLATLRWLGRMRLSTGAPVDVVAVSMAGAPLSLAFDPRTRHLRATLAVFPDALVGDVGSETEFTDYRNLNGVLLPTRRISRTGGEVTRDFAYTSATPGYEIADSMVALLAGMARAQAAPQAEPVRTLAPGVWAVGNPGAAALAVAFRDHVLVVDAPAWTSAEAVERIAALAPGKPIRYVVPTHHHDDHAGGVKHFAAAGAAIVTTPGNRGYMERIATARSTVQADIPPLAGSPRVETIAGGRRVFTDGSRTVEIHDIGPGPHAREMLVAWIPEEGILFQGDLIDVSGDGAVTRGTNNETTVHFAEWLRRRRWNVRVFGGTHGFLRDPAAFEEILRQPIAR
ncbi:MAG TPA: MBL fold metallo-hydrolase, partial [Longimicrobium sp.]|nr:MBL fold metallo-hydrolase [Longimicrobium sp.]